MRRNNAGRIVLDSHAIESQHNPNTKSLRNKLTTDALRWWMRPVTLWGTTFGNSLSEFFGWSVYVGWRIWSVPNSLRSKMWYTYVHLRRIQANCIWIVPWHQGLSSTAVCRDKALKTDCVLPAQHQTADIGLKGTETHLQIRIKCAACVSGWSGRFQNSVKNQWWWRQVLLLQPVF